MRGDSTRVVAQALPRAPCSGASASSPGEDEFVRHFPTFPEDFGADGVRNYYGVRFLYPAVSFQQRCPVVRRCLLVGWCPLSYPRSKMTAFCCADVAAARRILGAGVANTFARGAQCIDTPHTGLPCTPDLSDFAKYRKSQSSRYVHQTGACLELAG